MDLATLDSCEPQSVLFFYNEDGIFFPDRISLNNNFDQLQDPSLLLESKRMLSLLKASGKRKVTPPPAVPKISGNDLRSVLATPHPSHFQALQETLFCDQSGAGTVDMWPLQLLDFVEKKKLQATAVGHGASVFSSLPVPLACGQEQSQSIEVSSQQTLPCPNPPAGGTPLPPAQTEQTPALYAPREVVHSVRIAASLDKQKVPLPIPIGLQKQQQTGTGAAAPFNFEHTQAAVAPKPAVIYRNPRGSVKPQRPKQMHIPSSGGGVKSSPTSNRQSKLAEGKK
jgi:hypothetical protein